MKRILFLSLFLIGSSQAMEPAKTVIQSAGTIVKTATAAAFIINDCTPTATTVALAYYAYVGCSSIKDYFTRK